MLDKTPTPLRTQVQKYLDAVAYPAHKADLWTAAKENGAPHDLLKRIEDLPGDRYEVPAALLKAFGEIR
jgi:hypothetical protein